MTARPKFPYVRDTRLRDMCRALPCQWCCADGPDAGVTWAHSNWQEHGKGRQIKASDVYVAALCARCHSRLDQGYQSADWKRMIWGTAHERTVKAAQERGLWPEGVPVPTT